MATCTICRERMYNEDVIFCNRCDSEVCLDCWAIIASLTCPCCRAFHHEYLDMFIIDDQTSESDVSEDESEYSDYLTSEFTSWYSPSETESSYETESESSSYETSYEGFSSSEDESSYVPPSRRFRRRRRR